MALAAVGCVGDNNIVTDAGGTDAGVDAVTADVVVQDVVVVDVAPDGPCSTDLTSDPKNCGTCGHDCVGGLCTASKCEFATPVTGQKNVASIFATATKLYWARGVALSQNGGVFVSDFDGSNGSTLYDAGASGYCSGLQVTGTDAYFYCSGNIYRCTLPSCGGAPQSLVAVPSVADTALDLVNSRVYFAVYTQYNQQTGGFVASVPFVGGSYSRLVSADQPNPANILISSGEVYWLNASTYTADTANKNGGVIKAPVGILQSQSTVTLDNTSQDYGGLAVQGSTVYFGVGTANAIHSVATLGGSASVYRAAVAGTRIGMIRTDATSVYWTELGTTTGGVYKCTLNSCATPSPLATSQSDAYALALDALSVFWSNETSGEIRRIAK